MRSTVRRTETQHLYKVSVDVERTIEEDQRMVRMTAITGEHAYTMPRSLLELGIEHGLYTQVDDDGKEIETA